MKEKNVDWDIKNNKKDLEKLWLPWKQKGPIYFLCGNITPDVAPLVVIIASSQISRTDIISRSSRYDNSRPSYLPLRDKKIP